MHEKIVIFDFGSQYTQLIARRIREHNVYCDIYPFNKAVEITPDVKGVVLSGSPFSVLEENSLDIDLSPFWGKVPVLSICYGAQYVAHTKGGKVARSSKREYGKATLVKKNNTDTFFNNVPDDSQIWMSHGDSILEIPSEFELLASTTDIPVAAYLSLIHI